MTQQPTIVYVPVDEICFNRFQQTGFHNDEKINEIASSILQNRDNGTKGLLQVPTARKVTDQSIENGLTELAFGHHRYLAIKKLAESDPFFSEMPLILRELSDLEMFELMAIENFHRRDIDPLEEANTFHAYMTTFGKTSVETAQKFEKTEEYVRQSIRLLNLPEAAQDLVKSGTLTKTDARDLLVLNKLGGDQLVLDALDGIASPDPEDGEVPAKKVIARTLRMSNETKLLDMNDDWAKANKKFPVKHLKTITKDDVRNTLKRVATYQDDEALEDAIAGVVMLITSGMEIMDEAWPMFTSSSLDRLRVLVNPGPCEKCPIHAVVDGDHFCGLPLCFTRKERAFDGLFNSISNPTMLEYIANGVNQNPEYPNGTDDEAIRTQMRNAKFAEQIKIMRRYAAFCVIDQRSYDARLIYDRDVKQKKFVVEYAKAYKPILEELGLVIPKDYLQEAEKYQAELDKTLKELA